jgi:hypothetical protein
VAYDERAAGRARWERKRAQGRSPIRRDGSEATQDQDEQSACAEAFAALAFGQPFHRTTWEEPEPWNDGGVDFWWCSRRVDVVWLGRDPATGRPRETGHLLMDPASPQRLSDCYVLVRGEYPGLAFVGWSTHGQLTARPLRKFGEYKGLRYNQRVETLTPIHTLRWGMRRFRLTNATRALADEYRAWFELDRRSKTDDKPTNDEVVSALETIRALERMCRETQEDPDTVYVATKQHWAEMEQIPLLPFTGRPTPFNATDWPQARPEIPR